MAQAKNLSIAMAKLHNNMQIHVAVGVILNPTRDLVLVACRPQGKPYAGYWEFPGGKLEAAETLWQGLSRELMEEINICPLAGEAFMQVVQQLPNQSFLLDVWIITAYSGEPISKENQQLQWVSFAELSSLQFPPANESIVKKLQELYTCSPY